MRIVGVVAEYNPFHAGHAYQLQMARELARADAVVAVMSSVFTQRGDAALLAPADRVRMALSAGADAVFALPAAWAVRDAEHFALGGVSVLAGLGCDAISFGTETDDLALMQEAARLLESPTPDFDADVRARLGSGLPYPAAVSSAMEAALPGTAALLDAPNSTLAVCYLRAMRRLGAGMEVLPVKRIGGYHDKALGSGLPSATAIRQAHQQGDWEAIRAAMPEEAYRIFRDADERGRIHPTGALDEPLLYRLRTMGPGDFIALPDVSEGIENRLAAAAQTALTREELLLAAKTRRYPYARLSRLATHALLGMMDADLPRGGLPAAWLLGFRKDSRALMRELAARSALPIISKAADFDRDQKWFRTELRAYDIWSLGAGMPAGLALTQGVTVL